jgi:hypothetical protein
MKVPVEPPIGLTDEFANDESRQKLWQSFLKKNELAVTPLSDVVASLRTMLLPAINMAASIAPSQDP